MPVEQLHLHPSSAVGAAKKSGGCLRAPRSVGKWSRVGSTATLPTSTVTGRHQHGVQARNLLVQLAGEGRLAGADLRSVERVQQQRSCLPRPLAAARQ
jgi:hypothetical protein